MNDQKHPNHPEHLCPPSVLAACPSVGYESDRVWCIRPGKLDSIPQRRLAVRVNNVLINKT